MDSSENFQIGEHVVHDENAEFSLDNLQPFLVKDDGVLFYSMGHVYGSQYSKIFRPHCLIDGAEILQSKGCDFSSESAKKNQPSFRLNFEEYVHEKSTFKESFMDVNCTGFAAFHSRNLHPYFSSSSSQFVIEDPTGKYVLVLKYLWSRSVFSLGLVLRIFSHI
jgi:hypothetical protein